MKTCWTNANSRLQILMNWEPLHFHIYERWDNNIANTEYSLYKVKYILFLDALHYENTPIQIYRKFHLQKTENFQIQKLWYFFIFLLKT